jgi:hypothetical protein
MGKYRNRNVTELKTIADSSLGLGKARETAGESRKVTRNGRS